jgi:pyruvate decarboxylase
MVGGLSAINGVAGAYSEDLPLLIISGGPNTNDGHDRHLVHHTIGEIELYQSSKCFEPVVAKTFVIRNVKDCAYMIDQAILTALTEKKPVYLEIPVNMNAMHIPNPSALSFILPHEVRYSL